jgi:hypothetical protein
LWRQLEGDPALTGDSVLAHAAYWAEHGLVGGDWDTTDHAWEQLRTVLRPIVFGDLNYHIYTGSWSFERLTYFNGLFHSANWNPFGGSNYVTGEGPHTRYPSPYPGIDPLPPITPPNHWAHPWLDDVLATGSVPLITGYLVQHIVTIPLWSTKSYIAWRKEVSGVVNMKGVGLINEYSFLNAYRGTSSTIRVGIVFPWEKLNPLYSQWYFEHTLLDRCYTKLIATNPYQLSENIPWVAKDWTVGTWIDPRDGYTKSVVTYYLRENVGCASPITGTLVDTFDARDYEFTCWYNYAFDDSWQQGNFMDLHHLEIVNNHTVKAYFDDENAWSPYLPTYPLLGPTEVLTPKLCTKTSATFHGSDLVRGFYDPSYFEYQFTDECVVHVLNATKNGGPIVDGMDFYIRAGYDVNPVHCIFVNKTSFASTDVIKIFYYYAVPSGAGGIYLGGNLGYDWTDTMYSYGTHYSVSISADSASLKKNPYFFLPKPILGEIDWRYYYQGTTQPRNGYFKIEILDLVKCTSAYCSRGDGQYNPAYFPGADLDSSDLGHIGLLDLVTVTSNYGRQFG